MGFKITQVKSEEAGLEVYLNEIEKLGEKKRDEMLKSAGEKAKELVTANLLKHKRILKERTKIPFSDDVKLSIRTDKNGNKVARVHGGKSTGTLWHIVNDGTYRSKALHFLDKATADLDKEIDKMWGNEL